MKPIQSVDASEVDGKEYKPRHPRAPGTGPLRTAVIRSLHMPRMPIMHVCIVCSSADVPTTARRVAVLRHLSRYVEQVAYPHMIARLQQLHRQQVFSFYIRARGLCSYGTVQYMPANTIMRSCVTECAGFQVLASALRRTTITSRKTSCGTKDNEMHVSKLAHTTASMLLDSASTTTLCQAVAACCSERNQNALCARSAKEVARHSQPFFLVMHLRKK